MVEVHLIVSCLCGVVDVGKAVYCNVYTALSYIYMTNFVAWTFWSNFYGVLCPAVSFMVFEVANWRLALRISTHDESKKVTVFKVDSSSIPNICILWIIEENLHGHISKFEWGTLSLFIFGMEVNTPTLEPSRSENHHISGSHVWKSIFRFAKT